MSSSPPLGWNSFDSLGCAASEETLNANLNAMITKLKPAGYEYFVVDNGWFAEYDLGPGRRFPDRAHADDVHLDGYGRYQPSTVYFPNGFTDLIARTHKAGLKFGLHLMRGIPRKAVELDLPVLGTSFTARQIADVTSVCDWCPYNYGLNMAHPGAQAFLDGLLAQLAGWGVDFVKADDISGHPAEIEGLATAIERSGRPMLLSLSPGDDTDVRHLAAYRRADLVRTTGDIWDDRTGLDLAFAAWREHGQDTFWPDLDMIPFGQLTLWRPRPDGSDVDAPDAALSGKGFARWSEFTSAQMHTFITMRALAASPLFVGGYLPTLDEASHRLLTHQEMLACNQNGVIGRLVHEKGPIEIWETPDRHRPEAGWLGAFNRSEHPAEVRIGGTRRLHDVWRGRDLDPEKTTTLPPDGVLFCRYLPTGQ